MSPGRIRALGTVVAIVLVGLIGFAQTVDRAPLGWDVPPSVLPGQEIQRVTCPPRSYLVGFREVLGYWLYQAWPVCAPIDRDGEWTDGPAQTKEFLVNVGGLGVTGVNDFLVVSQTCPKDAFVFGLSGVIVRVKDENVGNTVFRMPGLIKPVCHKRSSSVDLSSGSVRDWRRPEDQGIPWASFEEPEYIGWRGFSSPSTCQPDEVAVGAWSVRDQWIRSVGLICEAFETMRPKSAVEVGASETSTGGLEVLGLNSVPAARSLRPGVAERVSWKSARSELASAVQPSAETGLELNPPRGPVEKAGIGDASKGARAYAECPRESAMTSIWIVGDDRSLQTMQIACTRVDSRGAWSGSTFWPDIRSVMLMKGFAIDDDSVFERLRKMSCPTGSFVAGFNAGVSRVDNRLAPWQALTECLRPNDGVVTEIGYPLPPGSMNQDHYFIGWDGLGGARSCARDEVGVGIWGSVSQDYVEALGLVCAPWAQVRPTSAVGAGANLTGTSDPSKASSEAAEATLRARVPNGATYVTLNDRGRKVKEFQPGEVTNMGPECVPVPCPTAIVRAATTKQIACWRCSPR